MKKVISLFLWTDSFWAVSSGRKKREKEKDDQKLCVKEGVKNDTLSSANFMGESKSSSDKAVEAWTAQLLLDKQKSDRKRHVLSSSFSAHLNR